jgi:hypothetical protein
LPERTAHSSAFEVLLSSLFNVILDDFELLLRRCITALLNFGSSILELTYVPA